MPTRDEIYTKVSATLVEALNVDEDDVTPEATLQGDLGAESIDFLDIVFRLEREFGIKIDQKELFPESLLNRDSAIIDDGRVTDEYLAALCLRMPYAALGDLERDRRPSRIDDLFTVGLLVSYIRWRLSGDGQAEGDLRTTALSAGNPV